MMQTKTFSVQGMHCGSCAVSIEMMIKSQSGVKSASVNFDSKEAVVEYDDTAFRLEDIKNMVQQMGYSLAEKNRE